MRSLAPILVLAGCLALWAPRAARASGPAGHRARTAACGRHHYRRHRRRRRYRRHRRRVHRRVRSRRRRAPEKKVAPPKPAAAAATSAATAAAGASAGAASTKGGSPLRRSRVMQFDARLVQGQTASSGAVYLFNRAPRKLPPLLHLKQSYLHLIVDPVLGPKYEKKRHH